MGLVLNLKIDEWLEIDYNIKVKFCGWSGRSVKLFIEAPPEIIIKLKKPNQKGQDDKPKED